MRNCVRLTSTAPKLTPVMPMAKASPRRLANQLLMIDPEPYITTMKPPVATSTVWMRA